MLLPVKEDKMKLRTFYENIYKKIFSVPFFAKLLKIPGAEKLLQYEIVSYLVFGVLTTVVNMLTYIGIGALVGEGYDEKILYTLKLADKTFDIKWVLLINAIAWIVSVLFSFVTNKLFVFESSSMKAGTVIRELVSFTGARILSFLIFEELIFMLLINIGIHHLIAKLAIAVFVVVFNFIASKLVIFRKKGENKITKEQEDTDA